ncbi:MAG: GTPase Era [Sphaerochaetaceae bacterium]|jgi:GTP-binding protein Era|nr:GTPase Era [Sphaerochaetaceae bacterium]HHU87978.1 GTPase Era [Spirochaetales bacterium]
MKVATVTLIGRPSSGKSTLINTICEGKVSITSTTPQTTRNIIRGVYTDQRGQLILLDTPGYHQSERAFNLRLQETTRSSFLDSDIVLYLLDVKRSAGQEEEAIIELLKNSKIPLVVALNKGDVASKKEIIEAQEYIKTEFPKAPTLLISAKEDQGVDELLIELFKLAPEGELLYPEETYTDQPLEFRIAEIIREKAILSVTEELPHAIYVEVADLEYDEEGESIWIRAFIYVERETQKGIVVGHKGEGIKKIRQAAFKDIRRLFTNKNLHLDLRVKSNPKWRQNKALLDELL